MTTQNYRLNLQIGILSCSKADIPYLKTEKINQPTKGSQRVVLKVHTKRKENNVYDEVLVRLFPVLPNDAALKYRLRAQTVHSIYNISLEIN